MKLINKTLAHDFENKIGPSYQFSPRQKRACDQPVCCRHSERCIAGERCSAPNCAWVRPQHADSTHRRGHDQHRHGPSTAGWSSLCLQQIKSTAMGQTACAFQIKSTAIIPNTTGWNKPIPVPATDAVHTKRDRTFPWKLKSKIYTKAQSYENSNQSELWSSQEKSLHNTCIQVNDSFPSAVEAGYA